MQDPTDVVKLNQSLSITQIEDAEEEDQRNLNQFQPNPSSSELGEIIHTQAEEVLMIYKNLLRHLLHINL